MEDLLIARTEALDEAKRELERVRQDSSDKYFRHGMVGRNAKMQRLFDTIDRVRNVAVPVVVQGESGTGKELVARAIHYGGPHAKAPFVTLNCASIPETLLESELFGHVRGAFTGAERSRIGLIARASGGTLLLDEIGDMSAKMQVELLRVIQEGVVRPVGGDEETPVTIRFIATSSIPLAKLVSLGRFREDLYYRLGVVEIELAPLRERRDDIPLLCDFFLQKLAKRYEQSAKRLSAQAMAHLCTRPWPGNVRQLEHAILNAWVMAAGNTIEVEDLSLESSSTTHTSRVGDQEASALRRRSNAPRVLRTGSQLSPDNGNSAYNESEKNRILQVLESNGGNKVKAAQVLGMARRTLYRRLLQYGIGYPSEEK
jgi:DNA-binding NtrC family response regulator